MRYAQILYDKAHWIFETNEKPKFAPSIILVDITEKDYIQEGWNYDKRTGEFTAPIIPNVVPTQETSVEEKLLAENQYQTMLLEIAMIGG